MEIYLILVSFSTTSSCNNTKDKMLMIGFELVRRGRSVYRGGRSMVTELCEKPFLS